MLLGHVHDVPKVWVFLDTSSRPLCDHCLFGVGLLNQADVPSGVDLASCSDLTSSKIM